MSTPAGFLLKKKELWRRTQGVKYYCIAEGIGTEPSQDPWDVIASGDLGYCEIFKFKCNGNRSCSAHIDGGPIKDKIDHFNNIDEFFV